MTATAASDAVELLGERLLVLGRLAREVPAAEFLAQAVGMLCEALDIRSAWWGLLNEREDGKPADLVQAEAIAMPATVATDWRRIAEVDPFARRTIEQHDQVQRMDADEHRAAVPPELNAFADRYGFRHIMALSLHDATTGQIFFVVAYRGADAPAFGDTEAALFRHLLRHTLQLWRQCLQDALSRASTDGIARAAWARPDGYLVYAGPALCELLYARWPTWDGLALPAELVQRFAGLPCTLRLPDGALELSRQGEHVRLQRLPVGETTPLLSPREQRVAHLFAAGLSYKEIARRLALRPATVRTYLRNAYLRLGVRNKIQLGNALGSKGAPAGSEPPRRA